MPRSGISISYGSSIFSFLRNLHTAFHSGCTYLHSHHRCIAVPVLLHPCQHLLLLLPLNMASVTVVRWNHSVVFIYTCFTTREVKHLFIYLLAICMSSFENSLFNSVPITSLGWWLFVCWVFEFPMDSGYQSLIRWLADKDFLPSYGLSL
jgi:hypothetical protein